MWGTIIGLWLSTAHGAEPAVHLESDGTVVGSMLLPAERGAKVRAVIGDPQAYARLSDEILSVEARKVGDCFEVERSMRGLTRPLRMIIRSCPAADGWTEQLQSSEDFSAYQATWRIEETEAGTQVELRLKTAVNLRVPKRILERNLLRSTRNQLQKLAARTE